MRCRWRCGNSTHDKLPTARKTNVGTATLGCPPEPALNEAGGAKPGFSGRGRVSPEMLQTRRTLTTGESQVKVSRHKGLSKTCLLESK
jgi:hypothetical protein